MSEERQDRAGTGIEGLDEVLRGGFPRNRIYLIQGDPGAGKTTLALQFLLEGVRRGERCLYIALSETKDEIRGVAESHGWSLEGLSLYELSAADQIRLDAENTIFHPSEIELQETTATLLREVERVKPVRVVFDSLSELRLLAQDALRYRRQILGLKQYFAGRDCTALLLEDRTAEHGENPQSVVHGVIELEQLAPAYGPDRRRLRVRKVRGLAFRGGFHDFKIERGGLVVFPRLVAAEHRSEFGRETVSSGIPELDALLGEGIDRGTSTLLIGPAGCGKSSLGLHYLCKSAERGEHPSLFMFDEGLRTALHRAKLLGIDLVPHIERGTITLQEVNPAELTPGEFAQRIHTLVEKHDSKMVMIDSLNGYLNSMPEERFLTIQLREILSYLNARGVTTLLLMAQHGFLGSAMATPLDVSYIADSVVLLRYFEAAGAIRRAISVVKRRGGLHETAIRELILDREGIKVGKPLTAFHGVLTGVPKYLGQSGALIGEDDALARG